jgi:hypothetical protein
MPSAEHEERETNKELLDASTRKVDLIEEEKRDLESRYKNEVELMTQDTTVQIARMQTEAKEQVTKLEAQVSKTKWDGEEKLQETIRKGRNLNNEAK